MRPKLAYQSGRLLIVDDEPGVCTSLGRILEHQGHLVTTAASGEEALTAMDSDVFDLILVDLKMPGMNGLEVMAEAKRRMPEAVVIILTGYGSVDSAIDALRQGAHDYLLKPCSVQELVASVEMGLAKQRQAQRRRELVTSIDQSVRQLEGSTEPPAQPGEGVSLPRYVRTRLLLLDRERQVAVAKGELLNLTPTEFRLLDCLMDNMNSALSYQELAQAVLQYECLEQEARRALKTHLWRLRKKLRSAAGDHDWIVNVRGKGYMFKP